MATRYRPASSIRDCSVELTCLTTLHFIEIRVEEQRNAVADEVAARFAVVRPILEAFLTR
jgi:hypothetical protein